MDQVYLLEDDESICELVQCTLDMRGIACKTFPTVKARKGERNVRISATGSPHTCRSFSKR